LAGVEDVKYVVKFLKKSPLTYGRRKTVWIEDQEYAIDYEDALEWEKTLKKDKNIKNIRIEKLKEVENE